MSELTVTEIAELVGGEVVGDADRKIHGVAPLAEAGPAQLSFVAKSKYLPYLGTSRAGVVLIAQSFAQAVDRTGPTQIFVEDPHAALTRVLLALQPEEDSAGVIHPTAVVASDVELAEGVTIGAYAVVGAGSKIGPRTRIGPHSVIGEECVIGEDCRIDANVTLYERVVLENRCIIRSGACVGGHGFGYVWMDGGHTKVPQIGGCRICDDVELGMNVTVDRGSVGETVVGRGTKVDNLVHIGHNVKIGEHVLLVAQVGISGSTSVGDGAVLAGQVGVAGHLTIGAGARIGGQAGVLRDVPAGATYSGMPARLHREVLRAQAALFRLPDIVRRVRGVERALGTEEGSTRENE